MLFAASPAAAGKVKLWQTSTPADYDRAALRGTAVSSEGAVRLGRRLAPLPGVEAAHVWDVAEDAAGNLYAATGDDGKVFRVTPAGAVTVAYTGPDSQVLCLAVGGDGAVYAGTGPGGRVVRIAGGEAKAFCDFGGGYVWSLAFAPDGKTLYAATGPKGRVYAIDPDGRAAVFFRARQDHVLSLACAADGTVYAGTDKDGLVYRIDPAGQGRVLFQAAQPEVRTLLLAADAVYAGTGAAGRKRGGSSNSGEATALVPAAAKTVEAQPVSRRTGDAEPAALAPAVGGRDRDADKGMPSPAPSSPGASENSVYRVAFDGAAREVFRDKKLVLGLDRRGGRLFVATGLDGRIVEVDEATRERTEVARLDHGLVHKILRRKDGSAVVAAGDPGKLYVLKDGFATTGTVVSEVFDAKLTSRWGALRWHADLPAGTRVSVAVRSGNVADPDDTWSGWSADQTDPQAAVAAAPPARYLQYRATLATADPAVTPVLHRVGVRYATANQPPEITALDVPDPEKEAKEPKKLRLKWTATDPNEDELTYSVYARKDGWADWVLLDDGLAKPEWDWDTTTTPAGVYRVKVVASDRPDNPDGEALAAERVSGPVTVAHDPPAVAVRVAAVEGDRATIEADAADPLSRLAAASFSINGRKWLSVFPKDGLFDDTRESFRFTTDALPPGTYVLVLRVKDAAGNTGTGDVTFTVKDRPVK
ncbi:MAG TPA: hypothetical protein VGF55_12815 [Gemmataceae bacterium]